MSTTTTVDRIPYRVAIELATDLLETLEPVCERIAIAGSLRRGVSRVKDIELVCVPKTRTETVDLFGATRTVPLTDEPLRDLADAGVITDRLDSKGHKANGPRYKRLLYRGVALDLFLVRPPAQWGLIFALRTGPAAFSRQLVTQQRFGGWLPNNWSVKEGAVYDLNGNARETPEEEDLFRLLRIGWLEPEDRL